MRSNPTGRKPYRITIPNGDRFSEEFLRDLQEAVFTEDRGFKSLYLKKQMLSKYCDPTTTPPAVRAANAIKKWLSTERRNAATNSRLFWLDATEADLGWITYGRLIAQVRKLIARILGPLDYPACFNGMAHTNGASTRVKRGASAALHKLEGGAHVSQSCVTHWLAALTDVESGMLDQGIVFQESSVLFTVPKKSEIDRVACKEPEINMLLQRCLGGIIRRRLRRVGINLNDQTVNQGLARTAVSESLATIDLSSASDSISSQLVQTLLPFEWWSLLDDLRVKSTLVDGELHELEMFSSMGNGFTFELESLLFYAITRVVCEESGIRGRISVFGDDIIAPSRVVPRLVRVFHLFGFKTNAEKTFYSGPFRESCGKHYHGNFDVTPFFVRRKVSTLLELMKILNQSFEWVARGVGFIEDPAFLAFHKKYSKRVPKQLWGGQSVMDPTSLVTGHKPRKHLIPLMEDIERNERAAYVHWHMSVDSHEHRDALEVSPAKEKGYRIARNPAERYGIWQPWFLEPWQPEAERAAE